MHAEIETRGGALSGVPPAESRQLTREELVGFICVGFGAEHPRPAEFRAWVESRSDEVLEQMAQLLEAAGKTEKREEGRKAHLGNELFEEFGRLAHASIEELVVAKVHFENVDMDDAAECLTAVNLNLFRMREIVTEDAKEEKAA